MWKMLTEVHVVLLELIRIYRKFQEHEIMSEVLDFPTENWKQSCNNICEADFIYLPTNTLQHVVNLSCTLKTHHKVISVF